MRKVQFEEMFPWELAQAIAETPLCYLPIGTLEWHGEHNAVGLDALKAHAVCIRAAQLSGGVVVPPLYWTTDSCEDLQDGTYLTGGVEHGERYHVPGNMFWLQPATYHNLLLDLYEGMRRRGFRAIAAVAGHWSERDHLAVVRASGAEFLVRYPAMRWLLVTDQEVAADRGYPREHAAGGETSLLMAIRPDLVNAGMTLETDGALAEFYRGNPEHLQRRRTTPNKYIGVFTAVADHSNDPELTASAERGETLLRAISEGIAARANALLG